MKYVVCLQSMTLKEACKESLVILKQVMEEKLNATNVEVSDKKLYNLLLRTSFCLIVADIE